MQIQKVRQGYKLVENFFHRLIEIPADWDYPKFSEIVKVNPLTKIDEKLIPYLPMDAVDVEKPNFNYFEERNLSDFPSLPKFQENDVLFASITPSTENGKTCIIENFSRKGIGSSELTVLRPTEKIIPKYLYYYVKSHRIRQFAISQMMGTTGRQRVPDYVFKKDLSFELPSKSEQQKIASILSNIDSLISQTQKEIEHTQRLKKGLMQKLLTRGIGHTKFKKIKTLYGKYEEIPEDWEYRKLSDVATIQRGKFSHRPRNDPKFYGGKYPFIQTGDVESSNGKITTFSQSLNELGFSVSKLFPQNTIVITIAANIGSTAITTFPVCFPDSLIGISSNKMNLLYLEYYLRTKKQYFNNIATNSAQKNINLETLRPLLIPIPNKDEQNKIATILENFDSKIQKHQEYKSCLETLKKGLMQKLLTGQIRVKV